MKTKIPTYCVQCYNGPDLFYAVVEDGLVRSVEPNLKCKDISPAGGRICVKAYGLVQKMYNPDRIRTPLMRTNPRKGKDEDPGWKKISWEKAFEVISEKMNAVRKKGLVDELGFPRLSVIMGQAGSPAAYGGTLPAFFTAWGPIDFSVGGGQGIRCYHSEHLYGEYWHRCFIAAPDSPRTELVISFGHNTFASGGAAGVMRQSNARERGFKRIQVEPHLSASAVNSDLWVPVKPKTDAAMMYSLINILLHENDRSISCDIQYLKKRTNSPYLVGPNGYFIRDRATRKPLVWDLGKGAMVHDSLEVEDLALEGEYTVSGIEVGADGETWESDNVSCKTSFQKMLDFTKDYTPEWASKICDIPVSMIREVAQDIIDHSHIGETIKISGEELPYRPVAFLLGKTVNNGPGGYQTTWARTILAMLIGALEVPGGTIGASQRLNKPHHDRWSSVWPGNDGFMRNTLNPTDRKNWPKTPTTRARHTQLAPLVLNTGWSQFLSPYPLAWQSMGDGWGDVPRTTYPDVVLLYRANPAISMYYPDVVMDKMANFPFFVCIGYTHDETNHFADIIIPDHTDLEGLQLIRFGPAVHSESIWKGFGFALRQKAVEPVYDTIDLTDLATELASRTGILDEYYDAMNAGLMLGVRLKGKDYDNSLEKGKKYSKEEIWDRLCRSSTMILSNGKDDHGLEWFEKNGYYAVDYPYIRHFLHPVMVRWGLRYEIPYQENIQRIGKELSNRLHENNIDWWDHQLDEYEVLPKCEDYTMIWDDAVKRAGKKPEDYGFWLINTRSMLYAWGSNAAIPMMAEAAKNVPGFKGALINKSMAEKMGIKENDIIMIESPNSSSKARAVLREGVRPDTIVFTGQFGHWKTPFAKDLNIPNLNDLAKPELKDLDSGGSYADVVKVSIRKVS